MDPKDVEEREFLVTLRGYSRDEVDAFKKEVAGYLRNLSLELAESKKRLKTAQDQLIQAREQAESAPAQPSEKDLPEQEPESPVREMAFKQVAQETERILMAAEQVAEQMHSRAQQEAAEILTDARHQAQHGFDQVEEAKRRAERDLDGIRESRTLIASQMEDIRRRLDETINRLRIPVESPVTPIRPRGFRDERSAPPDPEPAQQPQQDPVRSDPSGIQKAAREDAMRERERRLKQIAERQAKELEQGAVAEEAPASGAGRPEPPKPVEQQPSEPPVQPSAHESDPSDRKAASREEEPAEPKPEPKSEPRLRAAEAGSSRGALDDLLDEFRRTRGEQSAGEQKEAVDPAASGNSLEAARAERAPEPAVDDASETAGTEETEELDRRTDALGELPSQTARRLKRLLQEEHNDVLDRLRKRSAKAPPDAEQAVAPAEEQLERFKDGLRQVLGESFAEGHKAGGASGKGSVEGAIDKLVAKQVAKPLRAEVVGAIQAGLDAKDAASSVAERAGDVFRVWKGVRTVLLGEGMAYAAFHQGLLEAWGKDSSARKVWVLSEEDECPNDVCAANADAGPLDLKAAFPSGHSIPPAHGGCLCTLKRAQPGKKD